MSSKVFWDDMDFIKGIFPWAILLLCPLMHFFMMWGHDHEDKNSKKSCH